MIYLHAPWASFLPGDHLRQSGPSWHSSHSWPFRTNHLQQHNLPLMHNLLLMHGPGDHLRCDSACIANDTELATIYNRTFTKTGHANTVGLFIHDDNSSIVMVHACMPEYMAIASYAHACIHLLGSIIGSYYTDLLMQTLINFFACLVPVFIYNVHAYATSLFHTDYWNGMVFSYLSWWVSCCDYWLLWWIFIPLF